MRRLTLLILALVAAALVVMPLLAQSRADSARAEAVRSRGFIRAAETQLGKVLALLEPAPEGPPVVLDWRTGEWELLVGGYRGTLDMDARTATWQGVTAPVDVTFRGDSLEVRLAVAGYEGGVVRMGHREGRMIGTVTHAGESRPATAQRENLQVVRLVVQPECTFAQYTDGSWGHAPNTSRCFQALLAHAGPMKFTPRVYTPQGEP